MAVIEVVAIILAFLNLSTLTTHADTNNNQPTITNTVYKANNKVDNILNINQNSNHNQDNLDISNPSSIKNLFINKNGAFYGFVTSIKGFYNDPNFNNAVNIKNSVKYSFQNNGTFRETVYTLIVLVIGIMFYIHCVNHAYLYYA